MLSLRRWASGIWVLLWRSLEMRLSLIWILLRRSLEMRLSLIWVLLRRSLEMRLSLIWVLLRRSLEMRLSLILILSLILRRWASLFISLIALGRAALIVTTTLLLRWTPTGPFTLI